MDKETIKILLNIIFIITIALLGYFAITIDLKVCNEAIVKYNYYVNCTQGLKNITGHYNFTLTNTT